MKKVLGMCLCVALLCSGCGLIPEEEELKTAPVVESIEEEYFSTAEVKQGDITEYFTCNSTYRKQESQESTLYADDDEIKGVYVEVGDAVTAGTLLAETTLDSLEDEVEQQEAICADYDRQISYYEGLEAIENERETIAKQYGKSYDTSKKEQIDATLTDLNDKKYIADLKLGEVNEQVDKKRMISAIDGTVTKLEYIRGWNYRTIKGVTISIESDDYGFVFSTDQIDYFPIGTVYEISTTSGEVMAEVVKAVPLDNKEGGGVITMVPILDNSSLVINMKGTIKVITEEVKDVVYVPYGALKTIDGKKAVYVLDEDGMRELRYIETGLTVSGKASSDDNRVEVKSGLTVGEQVIIR